MARRMTKERREVVVRDILRARDVESGIVVLERFERSVREDERRIADDAEYSRSMDRFRRGL